MNLGSKYIMEKYVYYYVCLYPNIHKNVLKSYTHLKTSMIVETVPNEEVKEFRICTTIYI